MTYRRRGGHPALVGSGDASYMAMSRCTTMKFGMLPSNSVLEVLTNTIMSDGIAVYLGVGL